MTIQRTSWTRFLAFPYILWLTLFLLGPLVFVTVNSFLTKGLWGGYTFDLTFSNYLRAADPLYFTVLLASLKLAFLTAVSCLIIGFPTAWYMTQLTGFKRTFAMILVMLPFMSNFVVRAYAVKFLIGVEGPLNIFFHTRGVIDEPLFLNSPNLVVWFGMVTNYLPFMILPLYVALERFDKTLLEAAKDLGARKWTLCRQIIWPLAKPAAVTGFALVFVPALGEFVIPDLMGGARTMFLGNLLAEEFLKARDWPFGSTLAVIMMTFVFLITALAKMVRHLQAHVETSEERRR